MGDPLKPMPDALDEAPIEVPGANPPIEPAPFPAGTDMPPDQHDTDDVDDPGTVTTPDDLLGTPAHERSDDPSVDDAPEVRMNERPGVASDG